MRRTDRLFELIQTFRSGRLLRGKDLADNLGISIRTLYRDIDTLIASGIPIEGERGVGYMLREPIFLPPLTLTTTELEAFHLGMKVVAQSRDAELAAAGARLMEKIDNVLPSDRQQHSILTTIGVMVTMPDGLYAALPILRAGVKQKRKSSLTYESLQGEVSERIVRPLRLDFLGHVWILTAWCELRGAFRVFRVDKIMDITETDQRFEDEAGKTYDDYYDQLCGDHDT